MRSLSVLGCAVFLMAFVGGAYASSGASFSGDRALIMKFRLDDGMTGGPGYRRAIWTSSAPVRATLAVRNKSGRLVETIVGGNPYSTTAGLTWISSSGKLVVSNSFPAAGLYRMTLTITAYEHGSLSVLSTDTVVAKWSAKLPDHSNACVPKVTSSSYIGCG